MGSRRPSPARGVMAMYKLTLQGSDLHHYGRGVYGWGRFSSTTGQPGELVQFALHSEAANWMESRRVFCAGAKVVEHSDAKE